MVQGAARVNHSSSPPICPDCHAQETRVSTSAVSANTACSAVGEEKRAARSDEEARRLLTEVDVR